MNISVARIRSAVVRRLRRAFYRLGLWQVFVFVASMLAGMALFLLFPADWLKPAFRRDAQTAEE